MPVVLQSRASARLGVKLDIYDTHSCNDEDCSDLLHERIRFLFSCFGKSALTSSSILIGWAAVKIRRIQSGPSSQAA
ncbi:hypothetical protein KCU89_g84, partial [Aureobasidium melanogenum]